MMVLLFRLGVVVIGVVAEGTIVLIGGGVREKVGTRLGPSDVLSVQLLKTRLYRKIQEMKIVKFSF